MNYYYSDPNSFYYQPIKLIQCSNFNFNQSEFGSYYNSTLLKDYYCIANQTQLNLNISGVVATTAASFISIKLDKCVNSRNNNNSCLSNDDITNNLTGGFIVIGYLDYLIDNNNITDPGQLFYKTALYHISGRIHKLFEVNYQTIEYQTDYGYLFQDNRNISYFTMEKWDEIVDIINGLEFC
jgi:hypothetical protein